MFSAKWNSTLSGLVLILSTLAAHAQGVPNRRDVVDPAVATAPAQPRSEYACPQVALVCELLADPAIRNFVGLAENAWDFNAPDGIWGFGPIHKKAEHTNAVTRACALRDLHVITLIEKHGDAQDIAGEKLAEAFFTVMRARGACMEGQESKALAIYDSITLVPVRTHAGQ